MLSLYSILRMKASSSSWLIAINENADVMPKKSAGINRGKSLMEALPSFATALMYT